jgi:hypothetical protein
VLRKQTCVHKFFIYIVLEVLLFVGIYMQRPKRQAAQDAIAKIRDIREWETLPEASQRFQECAVIIDAELESEIKKKKVKTCDLDMSELEEEEQDGEINDEYYDAEDGFVVADKQIPDGDPDFCLNEDEKHMLENETDDATSDEGCDEASEEGLLSEVAEIDESEEDSEIESEVESEEESQEESEDESQEQWEEAREQFEPVQCEQGPCEAFMCEPIECEPSQCEPIQCEPVPCEINQREQLV